MEKLRTYSLYSGIAAGVVFVIGTVIAMVTYPGYSLSGNFFSDTGLRVDSTDIMGRSVTAHPYPEIFNITLYVTAALLLPFFLSIPLIMNTEGTSPVSKMLYWLCTLWGLVIVPATAMVGIYDWGTDFTAHVQAAQTTLTGVLVFNITWILADLSLSNNHPYKEKSDTRRDLFVSIFIIVCSYTQTGLPVPSFMIAFISLQIYQKTAIYSALIYLAVIARRLLSLVDQD